ncbi:MAG: preprotein translocase subunit SecY [Patescibacteria group bacterium]
MQKFINTVRSIAAHKELRKKILFTGMIVFVYRFFAHVPVPAVNVSQITQLFSSSQFLSLLNVFSGGTLANSSIVAVGISPYITASIVMQLATMAFPALKEIQKDGEAGKEKVNQYTRLLSLPLAIVQSISVLALLNSQSLIESQDPLSLIAMISSLVAGSLILMWLGELISLYGIGNGISMVLLIGILSQAPRAFLQISSITTQQQFLTMLIFASVLLLVISLVVFMNEAIRKIPIQYAKRVRGSRVYGGQSTHLPIRVNVAGVLPIIFGVSIMLLPSFLARLFIASGQARLLDIGQRLSIWFAQTSPIYMITYFLIVVVFTFFSALIFFNAEDISGELKKSGAFVPGTRPGGPTKTFLEFVVTRITLAGAFFLGGIAILPSVAQNITGIQSLAIGGTSVLIIVSVILETSKQIQGMLVGQNYERFS